MTKQKKRWVCRAQRFDDEKLRRRANQSAMGARGWAETTGRGREGLSERE